jgi:RNase P subunit RPR2
MSESDSRARFLRSAARQYVVISPATSANLIASAPEELKLEDDQSNSEASARICKTCSALQVPGQNAHVVSTPTTRRKKRPAAKKAEAATISQVQFRCKLCGRVTTHQIDKALPARKTTATPLATPTPSASRQANRKKRSKAGLQSLLSQKDQSTKEGPMGFSLLDLMQKPGK